MHVYVFVNVIVVFLFFSVVALSFVFFIPFPFITMSTFVPFSPFILPHSSSRPEKIKMLHLNLWVALKYKATNYIYTALMSLFLLQLILLYFSLPLLSVTLAFPPFLLPYALFFTVTCVSTCLPLISAFTLQKPSRVLQFEKSSFQSSQCSRRITHIPVKALYTQGWCQLSR